MTRPMLAKTSDLSLLMGESDSALLELAVARASAEFIGEAGWSIIRGEQTIQMNGGGGYVLQLPALAVHSASVRVKGEDPVIAVLHPPGELILNGRHGLLERSTCWPVGVGNIEVTFDAGWDEEAIPFDIQDAILERALLGDSAMFRTETVGPYSRGLFNDQTRKWTEAVTRYQVGKADRA